MLVSKTEQLYSAPFESEAELEEVVWEYSELLFGANAIFLPKAMIKTLGGAGTIPDGFAIDIETETWFIVEAELASHGTWHHIAPQISKQVAAIEAPATRETILNLALDAIRDDEALKESLADLGIAELEIHGKLQGILRRQPIVAIPIDAIPKDLDSWANTLSFDIRTWVIEKYTSLDGKQIIFSLPDDNAPSGKTQTTSGKKEFKTTTRSSQPYPDVMSAGLIHVGQKVIMDYGQRGLPKQRFEGILREEGIEIEGRVMSLSAAAVYCIQKTGSKRHSANGWIKWKTEDGTYLNEFYTQFYAKEPHEQANE